MNRMQAKVPPFPALTAQGHWYGAALIISSNTKRATSSGQNGKGMTIADTVMLVLL